MFGAASQTDIRTILSTVLTTANTDIDAGTLHLIKSQVRNSTENAHLAFDVLHGHMRGPDSTKRLIALEISNVLFERSRAFRDVMCEALPSLVHYLTDIHSKYTVPVVFTAKQELLDRRANVPKELKEAVTITGESDRIRNSYRRRAHDHERLDMLQYTLLHDADLSSALPGPPKSQGLLPPKFATILKHWVDGWGHCYPQLRVVSTFVSDTCGLMPRKSTKSPDSISGIGVEIRENVMGEELTNISAEVRSETARARELAAKLNEMCDAVVAFGPHVTEPVRDAPLQDFSAVVQHAINSDDNDEWHEVDLDEAAAAAALSRGSQERPISDDDQSTMTAPNVRSRRRIHITRPRTLPALLSSPLHRNSAMTVTVVQGWSERSSAAVLECRRLLGDLSPTAQRIESWCCNYLNPNSLLLIAGVLRRTQDHATAEQLRSVPAALSDARSRIREVHRRCTELGIAVPSGNTFSTRSSNRSNEDRTLHDRTTIPRGVRKAGALCVVPVKRATSSRPSKKAKTRADIDHVSDLLSSSARASSSMASTSSSSRDSQSEKC